MGQNWGQTVTGIGIAAGVVASERDDRHRHTLNPEHSSELEKTLNTQRDINTKFR